MSPEQWVEFVTEFGENDSIIREGADHLRQALADRDRLAARLEVSDDPEMSPDKIDHLEGMLEAERRYTKRLAAELARVRSAIPLDGHDEKLLDAVQCHKDDPVRSVVEWGAIRRTVEYIRAALAQPQDGTTENKG